MGKLSRIFDIHDHVEMKLRQVMHDCKYFSLALDENTDVINVSQLLIFTRTIDGSFEVHEELLKLVSLHDTTAHIVNAVNSAASGYGGFDKLSTVVTVHLRCREDRGFAGLLRQSGVNCPILHCIIHQGSSLINCEMRFIAFLDEEDATYGDTNAHSRDQMDESREVSGAFLCAVL
ncbi:General transcription factor II-I repeat domain-containing protein 2 [Merluccius polli]|uniref:General transcription factor II-I repeat domain-containing protein 2 n=1 Tax=Merluccius polli TaxID=89951 RepID=A0AA47MX52_MERPO|nr:General transcription factor II-I repeat domain-containing protein 2 [Merluccius polli]